jgi:histidinol phosphatase-like enzyme
MNKALFLTFDDTLVTTLSGRKYSLHGEDWKFINQAVYAIRDGIKEGYMVCLLINQDAITTNLISERTFLRKLDLVVNTLERDLKLKTNTIRYAYCIDNTSYNYLPKPGMIYELATEYELDIVNSVLIGNSKYEELIAKKSGISKYIDISSLTLQST